MKFSHLTDTIILFGDEFDNFQTKLIRVGHNLHPKLGFQVLGCRSTSGQISVVALQTVVPSAIHYPEDEAKLASGNYIVNTNDTDLAIQVGKQYAGWDANGVKVNEEGLLKLHNSNYKQGDVVNLTLKSPVNATSVLYNRVKAVDLNHFASVTDFTYKFEHNTLSELKLHGVLENGKAVSRYLNQESDFLQVVEHYSNGND